MRQNRQISGWKYEVLIPLLRRVNSVNSVVDFLPDNHEKLCLTTMKMFLIYHLDTILSVSEVSVDNICVVLKMLILILM